MAPRSQTLPITVIIPCYNDGETLSEAVDSAIASSVETIVIVNDGSTDPVTCTLVDEYGQTGVTVLATENRGPGAARNCALELVTTPYAFNLDADDELLPGGLSRLYETISADTSRDVVWGDYLVFGEWDRVQQTADCIDVWQSTVLNDLPPSALFRTDLLRRVGGWQAHGYEDWDLWITLAESGVTGKRVPMPVYRYRTRPRAILRGRDRDDLRHDEILMGMRARHPAAFGGGIRSWLRSCCPWHVRVALALGSVAPLVGHRRRWFVWRVNELAHGRPGSLSRRGRTVRRRDS